MLYYIFRAECLYVCSDEVFSEYKHREIVAGCCPHPGDIVESGTLAVSIESSV